MPPEPRHPTQLSPIGRLHRFACTVRHLKARQIRGQIRRRVLRCPRQPGNGTAIARYTGCAWPADVRFLAPGVRDNPADAVKAGSLRLLSRRADVGFPPDWRAAGLPRLWQYNLHYFEWLWELDYPAARAAVADWIDNHRPSEDAVGWEPYPTSLRLTNWCAVFFGRWRAQTQADSGLLDRLWTSIIRQAQWLSRRLETHLLGNHYLENGAALAFVGSCFTGDLARRWFETGSRILREQLPEQVLPDGMHFERSPMYHCRAMYVLAMLMATGDARLREWIAEPLSRMVAAPRHICHPDGQIALLNDSALGICNEPGALRSFCSRLLGIADGDSPAEGCFCLPDAGYYGWRDPEGNYLICDFGRIGPDYIPGHAHADTFSFELSLRGHRVIVDAGVYDYEDSPMRAYCRGTSAHNTVEIDGRDQCELWGAFRVARRGYPHDVLWEPGEQGFRLSGWHDGYRRLPGRPVHYRRIDWSADGTLTVLDRVTSSRDVRVVSRVHLHPACTVAVSRPGRLEVEYPGGRLRIDGPPVGIQRLEEGWYCPQFGIRQPAQAVAFETRGTDVTLRYSLRQAN